MNRLFTIPDILTNFRFALIPVLIVLFSIKQTPTVEVYSFIIFTVAAMNDFIHRRVAKHYNVETVLGKLMDPLADKVLVATALIMLIPLGKITAWVCLLIICREIIVTGLRNIAATTGKEVSRRFSWQFEEKFSILRPWLAHFSSQCSPGSLSI